MIVDYSELGLMVCSRMRPVGETHGGVAHLVWSLWWRATTPLACEHKRREGADHRDKPGSFRHSVWAKSPPDHFQMKSRKSVQHGRANTLTLAKDEALHPTAQSTRLDHDFPSSDEFSAFQHSPRH